MEKIRSDRRKQILQQPLYHQFRVHYSGLSRGVVLVHKLVDTTERDFNLLIQIGTIWLMKGGAWKIGRVRRSKKIQDAPKFQEGADLDKLQAKGLYIK